MQRRGFLAGAIAVLLSPIAKLESVGAAPQLETFAPAAWPLDPFACDLVDALYVGPPHRVTGERGYARVQVARQLWDDEPARPIVRYQAADVLTELYGYDVDDDQVVLENVRGLDESLGQLRGDRERAAAGDVVGDLVQVDERVRG